MHITPRTRWCAGQRLGQISEGRPEVTMLDVAGADLGEQA
jgi:hypothetical protein